MEHLKNPGRADVPRPSPAAHDEVLAFHRALPGYHPTPLYALPDLARSLGLERLWVKDESSRLGLPAFKMLGASWATWCALKERLGRGSEEPTTFEALSRALEPLRPLTLVSATDGNHGRAVAHMARLLSLQAVILVPRGMAASRIEAIEAEGAEVRVVDGTYDDAVAASAWLASPQALVVSDTAWPGYQDIPQRVIDGYSTIFGELEDTLARRGEPPPDTVVVQMGVGALAAAAVRHYRVPGRDVRLLVVEPDDAACGLASAKAGHRVTLPGEQRSIMVGLNCATPSTVAWPDLQAGVDCFVAVGDADARDAMRLFAAQGIEAGETGAAGLAGVLALRRERRCKDCRCLSGGRRVLVLVTEGATDPVAYRDIVGREADEVRASPAPPSSAPRTWARRG